MSKVNREWKRGVKEEIKISLNEKNQNSYEGVLFPFSKPDKAPGEIGSPLTGAIGFDEEIKQNTKTIEVLVKVAYGAKEFFTKEKGYITSLKLSTLKDIVSCIRTYSKQYYNLVPLHEQILDEDGGKKGTIKLINHKIFEIIKINTSTKAECDSYTKFIQYRSYELITKPTNHISFDIIESLEQKELSEYEDFINKAIGEIEQYIGNQRSIKVNTRNSSKFNEDYPVLGVLLENKLQSGKQTIQEIMQSQNVTCNKIRKILGDEKLIEKSMKSDNGHRNNIETSILKEAL